MSRVWRILGAVGLFSIFTLGMLWFFNGRQVHTSDSNTKTITMTAVNYNTKVVNLSGGQKNENIDTDKNGVFVLTDLVIDKEYTVKGSSFEAKFKINKKGAVKIFEGSLIAGASVAVNGVNYLTQPNVIDIRSLKDNVELVDDNVISVKNYDHKIKNGEVLMLPKIPGQPKNIVGKVTHVHGQKTQKVSLEPVSLSDVYQTISTNEAENVTMDNAQARSWDGSSTGDASTVYAAQQPTVTLSTKNGNTKLAVHVDLDKTNKDDSLSKDENKGYVKNSGQLDEELDLRMEKFKFNVKHPQNTILDISSEYTSDLKYDLSIGGQIIKKDRLIAMIDVPIEEIPALEVQVPLYLHYEADGTIKLQLDYKNSLMVTAGVKDSKAYASITPTQSSNVDADATLSGTVGLHVAPTLRLAFISPKISYKYGGFAEYKQDKGINNLLRLDGSANLKYSQSNSNDHKNNSKELISGYLYTILTSPTVNWFMGNETNIDIGPFEFYEGESNKNIDDPKNNGESDFSKLLSKIGNKIYNFSYGIGGWSTQMLINQDGTFYGEYFDSDMGDTSTDYPNGTTQLSTFNGKFSEFKKESDTQYSMIVEDLKYPEIGKEAVDNGTKYVSANPYGLAKGDKFIVYLPGESTSNKPEELYDWIRHTSQDFNSETDSFSQRFTNVVLYDENQQFGWSATGQMDMTLIGSFSQDGNFTPIK
ncbi:hypothetical protein ESZ50_02420 [Weissella muntiaci]|uniref:Uncharacterized protein n=1 Tax=Weissella muntiaci TaxID=2508881 RepID=A0A6C2CB36_9LACO|nr:hypothetical protein [Weissella muntiaci]TYC50543.1 hypothetical protein ESZ50_02420 [Weissella muntiaci]